jgi:hypothetical protein
VSRRPLLRRIVEAKSRPRRSDRARVDRRRLLRRTDGNARVVAPDCPTIPSNAEGTCVRVAPWSSTSHTDRIERRGRPEPRGWSGIATIDR